MKRTVGIIGGMGPEATVALMSRVIRAVKAADDADHVPLIVDQNTQVPSRLTRIIDGTGADPEPVLVKMAKRLEAAGAMALAMPCNTAHHYAGAIRAAVKVPFLDMVDLSVAAAKSRIGRLSDRLGILASPAVRIAGVYDAACARAGLIPVYGSDEAALLALIRLVKRQGADDTSRAAFRALSGSLGAPVQLIACTEFSLLADAAAPGAEMIDTLDVLTQAIIAFSTGAANA